MTPSKRVEKAPRGEDDEARVAEVLKLAAKGRYTVAPNPRVGAILVKRGEVVGQGFHRRVGDPHAEAIALREAGTAARGATLYSNLEPCSHWGKTPPCAETVVAAGVKRVVISHADPDPRVAGKGIAALREAGIVVDAGVCFEDALELNWTYLLAKSLGRPAVTLKWAASLDGRIATARGESRWISSEPARDWALRFREERDAILVGSGTVLADDPRLTRREGLAGAPILRVVLDRRLRIPPRARLFDELGPVLLFTETRDGRRRDLLEERGATVRRLDRVTPETVLASLAGEGVQSVLIEGGGQVAGSFVSSGLVDEVVAIVAPSLIGGDKAPGPVRGPGLQRLSEAIALDDLKCKRLGPDLLVQARRAGSVQDLRGHLAGLLEVSATARSRGKRR